MREGSRNMLTLINLAVKSAIIIYNSILAHPQTGADEAGTTCNDAHRGP